MAFGWLVFGYAFWFVLGLYVSAPEQVASFMKEKAAIRNKSIEANQIKRVNEALTAALEATLPATSFYREHLAHLSSSERLSQPLLETGTELTSECRRKLAIAMGTIDGIAFANDPLSRYSQGLSRDLQGIDGSMAVLERFFRAYSSRGGPERAIRELRAADTAGIFSTQKNTTAVFTRLGSWHEKANALLEQLLADDAALVTAMDSFNDLFFY